MKSRLLIIIGIAVSSLFGIVQYADAEESTIFIIDGFPITINSKIVSEVSLNWSPINNLAEGTIALSESYDGIIEMKIPKSMPRTMNLDFGTKLVVEGYGIKPGEISETESECFYNIQFNFKNSDYLEFGTLSVAAGRWEPVTIQNEKCSNVSNRIPGGSISQDKTVYPVPWEGRPPLKQYRDGISSEFIQCKEFLVLMIKHDGYPACVMKKNFDKLIQRNWGQAIPYNNLVMIDIPSEMYLTDQAISFKVEETGWGNPCNSMFLSITNLGTNEIVWDKSERHPCYQTPKNDFFTHVSYVPDSRVSELSFKEIGDYKLKIESKNKILEHYFSVKLGEKENEDHMPLDIASIKDGRIKLYPVNTCAGIDIDRLTLDELNQRYPATYTTKSGKIYEIKFLSIDDNDLKEVPVISELIRATHHIPFPLNGGITASKGLVEDPDWNDYRDWYDQKKTEQFNLDEVRVSGFVYNEEYYSIGFGIC